MTPEKKAQQRINRHNGRIERKRMAEFAEVIRQEAISRSQILGRNDKTVWGAYYNLKEERVKQ